MRCFNWCKGERNSMRKFIATLLLCLATAVQVQAIYKDDFKLADSSEVRSNIFIEIRSTENNSFVTSWVDRYDLDGWEGYIAKYDMNGERMGNTVKLGDDSLGVEYSPIMLAVQKNGYIVAVWSYQNNVHPPYRLQATARIYDSLLNPITPEIKVDTISDTTRARLIDVWRVASDSGGNFVVLYSVDNEEPFLQKFTSTGVKVGGPVGVNTPYKTRSEYPCQDSVYTCGGGGGWDMDMRPNGELIVVYWGTAFFGYPKYQAGYAMARLFNPDLTPKGQVFLVPCEGLPCTLDDTLLLYSAYPKVEYTENGGFVVTWEQGYDPNWTYLVAGRRFNVDGTPKGPPFIVNDDFPQFIYLRPRIAVGKSGDFVIFWSDRRSQYGWHNLWAQYYDSSGAPQGINYRVNTPDGSLAGNEEFFDAYILDSTFVIAWLDVFRDYPPKIGWPYAQIMDTKLIGVYTPGDLNGDWGANLSDLIYLVNYTFKGGPKPYPVWTGDVNASCNVNLADIIYFVNYLFKAGPKPKQGCAK